MMLKSVRRSHCWLMRRCFLSSSSSVDRLCVENAFPRQGLETLKSFRETKFDESVDVSLRLNLDPRKPNQAIRKQVRLPHGMYTDRVSYSIITNHQYHTFLPRTRICPYRYTCLSTRNQPTSHVFFFSSYPDSHVFFFHPTQISR